MKTTVLFTNDQEKLPWTGLEEQLLQRVAEACLQEENFDNPVKVAITLVDDPTIREVNAETRQVDRATDVLSFPLLDLVKGRVSGPDTLTEWDYDPEDHLLLLGDIMISLETAKRQAEEYGHTFQREIGFLTAHGMFHLLGYDHMEPDEEKEMLMKEEKVLSGLGLKR